MIKEAVAEMLARVEEDPTQKIPRIYNEVRSKYTEKLDLDSRCSFLQDFKTYRNIKSRLRLQELQFVLSHLRNALHGIETVFLRVCLTRCSMFWS